MSKLVIYTCAILALLALQAVCQGQGMGAMSGMGIPDMGKMMGGMSGMGIPDMSKMMGGMSGWKKMFSGGHSKSKKDKDYGKMYPDVMKSKRKSTKKADKAAHKLWKKSRKSGGMGGFGDIGGMKKFGGSGRGSGFGGMGMGGFGDMASAGMDFASDYGGW